MPFCLLAYNLTTGAAASDTDLTAATDAEFSQRNNHYIFSEQYQLLAAAGFGATLTRQNMQVPTWNAIGRPNIWPVNTSLLPPSNPQMDLMIGYPPPIPMNEEFTVKTSNTGAGEQNTTFLWLGTQDWNANLPRGRLMIEVRVTFSPTTVLATWSGLVAMTFEQSLRGGVYAVVGAQCQGANLQAFRMVFPRAKMYQGRKMRPGYLATPTIGQIPAYRNEMGPMIFGEWGRFHTFEPPQVEFFATTSATTAYEMRMWLVYLGEDQSLLGS